MSDKSYIFLDQAPVAFVGVSSNEKKFGNYAFKTLQDEGYKVAPLHHTMTEFLGNRCYRTLSEIDPAPKSLIICAKPDNCLPLLAEFKQLGGEFVWFQQGFKSSEAAGFCETNGIEYSLGKCILMNSKGFPHSFHRFIMKMIGKF